MLGGQSTSSSWMHGRTEQVAASDHQQVKTPRPDPPILTGTDVRVRKPLSFSADRTAGVSRLSCHLRVASHASVASSWACGGCRRRVAGPNPKLLDHGDDVVLSPETIRFKYAADERAADEKCITARAMHGAERTGRAHGPFSGGHGPIEYEGHGKRDYDDGPTRPPHNTYLIYTYQARLVSITTF